MSQAEIILGDPTALDDFEARHNHTVRTEIEQFRARANEFLAGNISEDDFRVNMGDHKVIGRDKLPPQIVKAFSTMQAGQVTGLIQIESAYTIIRLNAHNAPKKQSLEEVKADLKVELQKEKYEKMRSGLAKQLRAKAGVSVVVRHIEQEKIGR